MGNTDGQVVQSYPEPQAGTQDTAASQEAVVTEMSDTSKGNPKGGKGRSLK